MYFYVDDRLVVGKAEAQVAPRQGSGVVFFSRWAPEGPDSIWRQKADAWSAANVERWHGLARNLARDGHLREVGTWPARCTRSSQKQT